MRASESQSDELKWQHYVINFDVIFNFINTTLHALAALVIGLRSLLATLVSRESSTSTSEVSTQREQVSSESSPNASTRKNSFNKIMSEDDILEGGVAIVNDKRTNREGNGDALPPPTNDTSASLEPSDGVQKILIVEDSLTSIKLYKKMFMCVFARFNISLQIDVASDGDEAVRLVQAGNKYLVITMDMEMERVGGIDAAKLLRILRVRSRIGEILRVSYVDHFIL